MGIDFINVEFRKHVKVSGDLGTTGSVCPFSQKQKWKHYRKTFCLLLYNGQKFMNLLHL